MAILLASAEIHQEHQRLVESRQRRDPPAYKLPESDADLMRTLHEEGAKVEAQRERGDFGDVPYRRKKPK